MVRKIISILEIDKAIILTSSSTIVRALSGFILSLLIAFYFTDEEQGLYFTFISITSIQLFFELGLGSIIIQFVAHEMPNCLLDNSNRLIGNRESVSRISSILRFCIRWYLIASILLLFVLLLIGTLFFTKTIESSHDIIWKPQWFALSIVVSLNLFFSFLNPFLQGMGKVKEMAGLLLTSQILSFFAVMLSMLIGLKLEIPAISLFTSLITLIFLLKKKGYFLIFRELLKVPITKTVNYKDEIFPLQAKTGISWASGYLLNYSFTPIIFSTMGAAAAGKFGLTLTVIKTISTFTLSWVSTKIPLWSGFINSKRIDELNKSFLSTIKNSTIVSIVISIAFITLIYTLGKILPNFTERFLPLKLIAIWSICIPITNVLDGMATKIRCYKQEPYSTQAVILGLTITSSAYLTTKFFNDLSYFIITYTIIICLINLPWSTVIYLNKTKEYNAALQGKIR